MSATVRLSLVPVWTRSQTMWKTYFRTNVHAIENVSWEKCSTHCCMQSIIVSATTYLSISEVVNYEDCNVEKSIKRTFFESE